MAITNPAFFLFDVMKQTIAILGNYYFMNISLLSWITGFICTSMLIGVFWKGVRG